MKTKKRATSKVVTKKVAKSNTWVIAGLVVLAVIVGWQLTKKDLKPQSLDINRIDTSVMREYEMANWTFDTSADFGTKGVWKTSAPYAAFKNIVLQDGKLVWPFLVDSAQLVAPSVSLLMTDDMTNVGSYVIKVKAEVLEQALTKTNVIDPSIAVNPTEYTMRVVGMDLVRNANEEFKERALFERIVTAKTNDGMKEYEFVLPPKMTYKVTRLRFYPYKKVVQPAPKNNPAAPTPRTRMTLNVDNISVVKRFDAKSAPQRNY